MYTLNVIGAGRLGQPVVRRLSEQRLVICQDVCNLTFESSCKACEFIGAGRPVQHFSELEPADIVLITTPDTHIVDVCNQLVALEKITPECMVVHCSASLPAECLQSAKDIGCQVVSVHPMRSFVVPEISYRHFRGTFCGVEGDEQACELFTAFFTAIGARVFQLNQQQKVLHHASAVFAANYLVTLSHLASQCAQAANMDALQAREMTISLMSSVLENLKTTASPEQALSGPLKRGDVEIISNHVNALKSTPLAEIYQQLGLLTLSLTEHDAKTEQELASALNS